MKIWEKIYLFVIILFLLVLNICNIIVFRSSYEKSLESVENTAVSFWRHIASSMTEDMAEIGEDETLEWQLFQTYVSEYSTQGHTFELWRKKELCAKSESGTQITLSAAEGQLQSDFLTDAEQQNETLMLEDEVGQVAIREKDGEKHTCTSGRLSGTHYRLVIYENVSGILTTWEKQLFTFGLTEIIASLLMAVLLYLVMRKFLEPVSHISKVTAKIAAGDYYCHIRVKGKDELSKLAEDINYMTEQVRENIQNKEAEARRKQEFIDALSHELRTPLTSVRGYAQLMQNTDIGREKQLEYADYIVRESGRMVDITEILRKVLLLQQEEIVKEEISCQALTERLQQLSAYQLTGKEIHWHFEAGGGVLYGNPVLTEILFMNLIRNSFHACGENGDISVIINENQAFVTDNGIGMSKECREHIFEPFYREDKSRSRKLGGTGLGMYFCRHIADSHGWRFHITSEKGKGTQISIQMAGRGE